jgi:hypothetical protein
MLSSGPLGRAPACLPEVTDHDCAELLSCGCLAQPLAHGAGARGRRADRRTTSTVSGGGDQGADPNKLVAITDDLNATAPGTCERLVPVRNAGFGEVLRGVAFAPGTEH